MPRRSDISFVLIIGSGPVMLAACGQREAVPAQMEQAARACEIRTFAVAPSGAPDQSPFALHFDSFEAGIDDKLACYRAELEAVGARPTLGIGSVDFNPRNDLSLLFARIGDDCGVPAAALTVTGKIPTIFGRGLDRDAVGCAVGALRRSGRFERIDVRPEETPPPPPTVGSIRPGDRN